jgi:osmotically-inducible protein OsmY
VSWDAPEQYHALLNLEFLSVESACAAIARLVEQPEFQRAEAVERALDDATLACRVWAAIAKNPETRNAGVDVKATAGTVVITGSVGSSKTTELLAQTAQQVEGVQEVRCEVGMGQDWYW